MTAINNSIIPYKIVQGFNVPGAKEVSANKGKESPLKCTTIDYVIKDALSGDLANEQICLSDILLKTRSNIKLVNGEKIVGENFILEMTDVIKDAVGFKAKLVKDEKGNPFLDITNPDKNDKSVEIQVPIDGFKEADNGFFADNVPGITDINSKKLGVMKWGSETWISMYDPRTNNIINIAALDGKVTHGTNFFTDMKPFILK
jgi:hypothetical protein